MEQLIQIISTHTRISYCIRYDNKIPILILSFKDGSVLELIEKKECEKYFNKK